MLNTVKLLGTNLNQNTGPKLMSAVINLVKEENATNKIKLVQFKN